jgi:hypothetical protein
MPLVAGAIASKLSQKMRERTLGAAACCEAQSLEQFITMKAVEAEIALNVQ